MSLFKLLNKSHTHTKPTTTHTHTHTHTLQPFSCPPPAWTLTSSPFCLNLPLSPLCSLLFSSSPHLLVLLYLSSSSTTLFSVHLPIPINFPTSQWLRNWQSAWCLDSWSSVPAIWICLAFTFTTTLVHSKQPGWPHPIYLASLLHFGRQFLISPHSSWHVLIQNACQGLKK